MLDPSWLGLPRGLPAGALGELAEVTLQQRLGVMGVPLDFQTNDPRVLRAAQDAFGGYPSPDQGGPPLLYRLFVQEGNTRATEPATPTPPRQIMRTQGHLLYTSLGQGNVVVADLRQGFAFGFITPWLAEQAALLRYHLVQGISLCMLAVSRGWPGIHASCVHKEGVTLVINGSAGAGKSTTAYACVRRGYKLITEDGLNLQIGPEGLRIWGIPWMLHLLPDSVAFFPELAEEKPQLQINGEWKLAVDVERYWPGATCTHAQHGLVLFMDRSGPPGPPEFIPLPLEEAARTLGLVWPWQVGWNEEMTQGVAELLDGRAYRIRVSGPPDAVVDALDEMVCLAQKEINT